MPAGKVDADSMRTAEIVSQLAAEGRHLCLFFISTGRLLGSANAAVTSQVCSQRSTHAKIVRKNSWL